MRYKDVRLGATREDELSAMVERVVVQPVFRSGPWDPRLVAEQEQRQEACVLLVGESGTCRSALARATLEQLLEEAGLAGAVVVDHCASRDYSTGEGPEAVALAVAQRLGIKLPQGRTARVFQPAVDIVRFDLVLVMDKFTAADVMREVSSFDLISRAQPEQQLSVKVRRLGEFGSGNGGGTNTFQQQGWGAVDDSSTQDIDDPLYGNTGGPEEEAAVVQAALRIGTCCQGVVRYLQALLADAAGADDGGSGSSSALGSWSSADTDAEGDEGMMGDPEVACELPLPGQAPVCYEVAAAAPSAAPEAAPQPRMPALGPVLRASVAKLGPTQWLAPPMLSPRQDRLS